VRRSERVVQVEVGGDGCWSKAPGVGENNHERAAVM
jgi:hypothetical protein